MAISKVTFIVLSLFIAFFAFVHASGASCPNGCSSRGLCINGVCQCADGLGGPDCSITLPFSESLIACPTCYVIYVGPAQYFTGPSWRLPDGPAVQLNNQGTLTFYQANGDTEIVSTGNGTYQFVLADQVSMNAGPAGNFDECGAWGMRVFADPVTPGNVNAFYHAESACNYTYNGQTHKSIAIAQSTDGGQTFSKTNYPNNQILTTGTPPTIGQPTGDGDPGFVVWRGYYYGFYQNSETSNLGVARAPVSSHGAPGNWMKYNNIANPSNPWSQPGLGGIESPIYSLPGTNVYVHTPTDTLVSIGGNYVWGRGGAILSVSNDSVNWNYIGDPLVFADPNSFSGANGQELITYLSALGNTGGYDIGWNFSMWYMWAQPWRGFGARYQLNRQVSILRAAPTPNATVASSPTPIFPTGMGNTIPQTRLALTTYTNRATGERWDTREWCPTPYMPTRVIGYLMTRPYPNSIALYDCWQYGPNDHFVSFFQECITTGYNLMRPLGFMFANRQPNTIAIYRCVRPPTSLNPSSDTFISDDSNCEGLGPAQNIPFGYLMQGPSLSSDILSKDILVFQGSAGWKYMGQWGAPPPATWTTVAYDDSSWGVGLAPFTDSYSLGPSTYFGAANYYFRYYFTVPAGKTVVSLLVSVASDDNAQVNINGKLIDDEGVGSHHEAAYWNRRIVVNPSVLNLNGATNVIAVLVRNADYWAMFDLQMDVTYSTPVVYPSGGTCANTCVNGNCGWNNQCACDPGWSGNTCSTPVCNPVQGSSYTSVVVPSAAPGWKYTNTIDPTATPLWNNAVYTDYYWAQGLAPFGVMYPSPGYPLKANTTISNSGYLYRLFFNVNIPVGQQIVSATLYTASDDFHISYINSILIDGRITPYFTHAAGHWNGIAPVNPSVLLNGANLVAVQVPNWPTSPQAYFDMQLTVTFATVNCNQPRGVPSDMMEMKRDEVDGAPSSEPVPVPVPESQSQSEPDALSPPAQVDASNSSAENDTLSSSADPASFDAQNSTTADSSENNGQVPSTTSEDAANPLTSSSGSSTSGGSTGSEQASSEAVSTGFGASGWMNITLNRPLPVLPGVGSSVTSVTSGFPVNAAVGNDAGGGYLTHNVTAPSPITYSWVPLKLVNPPPQFEAEEYIVSSADSPFSTYVVLFAMALAVVHLL